MPTRILREGYLTSPSVARCSPGAQDRLPRYWLAADDFGCFDADPRVLRGRLFVFRDEVTEAQIASDLIEYAREGMLETWTENERTWGFFRSWGRHQRLRKEDGEGRTVRKTPVPPGVKKHATLAAFYQANGDRSPCGNSPQPAATCRPDEGAVAGAAAKLVEKPAESASPPPPTKAKRPKKQATETPSVEACRSRLVAFIRSQGTPYVENIPGERKKLRDALSAPGVTEATIEAAFRELYARGKRPGVMEVGWVLRAAAERPAGRNGSPRPPGSELRDFVGFDDEGHAIYRDEGTP